MGVTGLWNIVTPLSKVLTLSELRGKTVAIDLSCWIVDSQTVGPADTCPKKYLRNIFFRTVALLLNGILPVFVLEGEAPMLKHDAIRKRNNARTDNKSNKSKREATTKKGGRGNAYNATMKECQTMLQFMGLSCIAADGEAEAMCAYLNADGVVDGCITQDSDCFLYGAKIIYRNFTLNDKSGFGCAVEEYSLQRIEDVYSFGRNKMIALALLCGCDYDEGVPGIGKDGALKWLQTVDDNDILQIFRNWANEKESNESIKNKSKGKDKEKLTSNECQIKKKCMAVESFPNQNIIDEFVVRRGNVPSKINEWNEPDVISLIKFLSKKLKWKCSYTIEKVIPVLTRWNIVNLTNIDLKYSIEASNLIIPKRIIKIRNIQSVCNYEIEWAISDELMNLADLDGENACGEAPNTLSTIEPQELVQTAYPGLVGIFEKGKAASKEKPSRKRNVRKNDERGDRKIDQFFKAKRADVRKVLSEIQPTPTTPDWKQAINTSIGRSCNNRKPTNRRNVSPKLNNTINNIYETLREEDFLTDVEDDALEMSLIVSSVCKSVDSKDSHGQVMSPTVNIGRSNDIVPDNIVDLESSRNSSISDEFDDDIPYVPLDVRVKN